MVWASTFKSKLNGIWLKQKHAARIIFRKKITHPSRPLLKELGALNIYQINISQILKFIFNYKFNANPKVFKNYFSKVIHNYSTRFSYNNFKVPKSSLLPKFSIKLRGPKIWNHFLSEMEKVIQAPNHFKKTVKNKLLNLLNELFYY